MPRLAKEQPLVFSLPEREFPGAFRSCALQLNHPSGAIFDTTRKYRYLLWRNWDNEGSRCCFIMLNPSTADAHKTDPTIARCISFATKWGYGGLMVANLFSFRVTDSSRLRRVRNPVGTHNDQLLLHAARNCQQVVLAWGNLGSLKNRSEEVLELLSGFELHHLGLTKLGHPRHPLYVHGQTEQQLKAATLGDVL